METITGLITIAKAYPVPEKRNENKLKRIKFISEKAIKLKAYNLFSFINLKKVEGISLIQLVTIKNISIK